MSIKRGITCMSELTEKIDSLLSHSQPTTFAAWVDGHDESDREAIRDALYNAYSTRSYEPTFQVLTRLETNPWPGGKGAMINYAIRLFD